MKLYPSRTIFFVLDEKRLTGRAFAGPNGRGGWRNRACRGRDDNIASRSDNRPEDGTPRDTQSASPLSAASHRIEDSAYFARRIQTRWQRTTGQERSTLRGPQRERHERRQGRLAPVRRDRRRVEKKLTITLCRAEEGEADELLFGKSSTSFHCLRIVLLGDFSAARPK